MEKISNKFNVRNVMIIVILAFIVSIILLSCKGNSTPVDVVKNGTFDDYPDVLIGKAFDSFFANPKWESFTSEDNEQIVEFSGGAMLGEEDVTVEMQFEVKNNSFEAFWLGVNGEDQSNEELFDWIDTACQEYQKSNKNTSSNNNVSSFDDKVNYDYLFPVSNEDEKIGFINKSGKLVIGYDFDLVDTFSEGFAMVEVDGQKTYINTRGESITDLPISSGLAFSEGLACISIGDKKGYMNTNGELSIGAKYDYANSFSDGLALVTPENYDGKVFIDKSGNVVIELPKSMYDGDIKSFTEGLAYVEFTDASKKYDANYIGFIDKTGNIVIKLSKLDYSLAHSFSDGLAMVYSIEPWGVGYIDKTGKFVLEPQYDYSNSRDFKEGIAFVGNGYINKKGEIIASVNSGSDFSDGLAAIATSILLYGFIDKSGKTVIKPQYNGVYKPFINGLALVQLEDRLFYIDKNGKIVCEF